MRQIYELVILLLIMADQIIDNQAANILFLVPLGIKNLYYLSDPLISELLRRGNMITAVTAIPFPQHQNLSQIIIRNTFNFGNYDFTKIDKMDTLEICLDAGYLSSMDALNDLQVQSLLKSNAKFELVINADLPVCLSMAAIANKFNAQSVSLVNHNLASHVHWILGETLNPAYQPEVKVGFDDRMTLTERMYNVYVMLETLIYVYTKYIPMHENLLNSFSEILPFLKDRPPLTQLLANKSLILQPHHPAIDYNYPQSNWIRSISGLTITKNKILPKHLEEFMVNSKHGVILLSWGSVVHGIKVKKTENIFLSAFASLKQNVIWKCSNLTLTKSIPPNVMVVDWLPQQDVLAHKNLRLFMSHGGINSITEAVHYGVPLIITPFFLDQHRNAKRMENSGMGIILSIDNITVESLLWTIQEVTDNSKYKERAMKRSRLFKDRVLSPVDEAVYWIEYVLKHGDVLKPATATLAWYNAFLLDIIAITLFTLFVTAYSFWYISKLTYKILRGCISSQLLKKKLK